MKFRLHYVGTALYVTVLLYNCIFYNLLAIIVDIIMDYDGYIMVREIS